MRGTIASFLPNADMEQVKLRAAVLIDSRKAESLSPVTNMLSEKKRKSLEAADATAEDTRTSDMNTGMEKINGGTISDRRSSKVRDETDDLRSEIDDPINNREQIRDSLRKLLIMLLQQTVRG